MSKWEFVIGLIGAVIFFVLVVGFFVSLPIVASVFIAWGCDAGEALVYTAFLGLIVITAAVETFG